MDKAEAKMLVKELGTWLDQTDEIQEPPEPVNEVSCYVCGVGAMKFMHELESYPPIPVFKCNVCDEMAHLIYKGEA